LNFIVSVVVFECFIPGHILDYTHFIKLIIKLSSLCYITPAVLYNIYILRIFNEWCTLLW